MATLPVLSPSMEFDDAARLVLDYLREHIPLAFWSVTRVENGRQTYLYLGDNDYGLAQGGSHAWESSFCIHMATGRGPTVAPDAQAVPAYASAAVNGAVPIGAYAGAVVSEPDGTLFGAICGLDPKVKTDDPVFAGAAPLLQLLGQLLTMVLAANRLRDSADAAVWTARAEADTDALTGLLNRRGWDRFVAEETARFARLGDPTVAVMIDLDHLKVVNDQRGHQAGDEHLRRAAIALTQAVRATDLVARLGGDEFAVLMRGCTESLAPSRVEMIESQLASAGVDASVGWASLSISEGLPAALAEADASMYDAKRARRASDLPLPRRG